MNYYRNGEGYFDPCAGEALVNIERELRRKIKLEHMQTQEDYACLCLKFRQMAEAKGFEFPTPIRLRKNKTGEIFKNG